MRTEPFDRASREFGCFAIELTPSIAEWALLKTDCNPRRVLPTLVARYRRDVEANRWWLGAGFLAFDQHGCLVQGRHTCLAVKEAGRAIRIAVHVGLSREAVRALDRGVVRTHGQILANEGYPYANALAAALKTLWRWEQGAANSNRTTPTIDEVAEWLERHPDVADAVRAVEPVRKTPLHFVSSISGAVYYVASVLEPSDADRFFIQLDSGSGLETGNPILTYRNWLIRQAVSRSKPDTIEMHALAIKAWNGWITGKSIKQLKWLRSEPFPRIIGRGRKSWPTGEIT